MTGCTQVVFKQALQKAKINTIIGRYFLRHSFVTPILENGTDLRYIQELLGDSGSTAEIYMDVGIKSIQQLKSPFDDL